MKARTILSALLLMLTTSIFATQRSAYCDYPTAHFDNEANGGLASLTITNIGNNTIALTMAPRADSDVVIDYLYVVVNGVGYSVGEDEGDILDEYTIEITFDEAPEEVTFSEIMWSNPDWGGRWMLQNITVPFDASCDVEATDEEDDNEDAADDTTTDSSISQYCDYPTAHFDNEANGGLASLTITNIGNNTIALTMAPRADSDVIIDYLYVVVNGVGYSVGEDEGDILDEYTIEITFDEAPEEVTFSEIMWSNPDWGGRWMLQNITVPFNASCDGEGSTEGGSTEEGEDTDTDDTTTSGAISEYCEYPTGHLNDPDFGDASSHILLTITKASENSTTITVAPRPDTAVEIDFLYVLINGVGYQVGTDEGDILDDYTVEVTFDEVPENVTISQIQWSTPGWEGRWAISDITVPFNASCDGEGSTEDDDEVGDDITPIMGAASIESISYTSVTLALSGTDKDNAGEATTITKFIINDTDNGIVDKLVTVTEGEVTITGLSVATLYYFDIRSQDNSGNISENGEGLMFQTLDVPETIVISDFEDATHSWEACEGSSELYVVDNPDADGVNTSSYVLQGGRTTDANFWAAAMIRNLSIPGGYHNYLHVMMYRNTIATVPNAKLSDTYSTAFEPTNETLVTDEWQDVVFDISGTFVDGTTIDFLYFMYDVGTLEEDLICYLDNIELNNDPEPRTVDDSSAIIESSVTTTSVYGANGTIYVKSATPATVTIYTLTGSTVTTVKAVESGEYTLPSGCYIVRVGAEIYKVVI